MVPAKTLLSVSPNLFFNRYDTLFVNRPDLMLSADTKYATLKSSVPREKLSQETKSKFAKFDRNIINEIVKYCGIQTVSRLSQVNSWLYKLCNV